MRAELSRHAEDAGVLMSHARVPDCILCRFQHCSVPNSVLFCSVLFCSVLFCTKIHTIRMSVWTAPASACGVPTPAAAGLVALVEHDCRTAAAQLVSCGHLVDVMNFICASTHTRFHARTSCCNDQGSCMHLLNHLILSPCAGGRRCILLVCGRYEPSLLFSWR